ncbi:hypothetical protein D3C72_2493630 [compost metagenome]
MFNTGDSSLTASLASEQIGFADWSSGTELWTKEAAEVQDGRLTALIPPHGVRLYRFEG